MTGCDADKVSVIRAIDRLPSISLLKHLPARRLKSSATPLSRRGCVLVNGTVFESAHVQAGPVQISVNPNQYS